MSQSKRVPILLFGVGGVGRLILEQIMEARTLHRERYDLVLDMTGLADSRGFLCNHAQPLGDDVLRVVLESKRSGLSLDLVEGGRGWSDLVQVVDECWSPGTILVDCTATSETRKPLEHTLSRGGKIVLANKKPLTLEFSVYRTLTREPALSRWETTVAAGLPVIATVNRIIASGDEVLRISGTYSGTLAFLMTGIQEGRPFSEVVREAYDSGYTEPDPREDLSGTDLGRKALILARGLGWDLSLEDVSVEPLVPLKYRQMSVPEFLSELSGLDEKLSLKGQAARGRGNVLRYVADVAEGRCQVGLREVPRQSPLGQLRTNDNLVEIETRVFSPNPLVIQGRGAGVPATAAGALSDIFELAFTETPQPVAS